LLLGVIRIIQATSFSIVSFVLSCYKQGVALTKRNITGPPRASPGELRCICAVLQTTTDDRQRQTQATVTNLAPYIMCRRASNKPNGIKWKLTYSRKQFINRLITPTENHLFNSIQTVNVIISNFLQFRRGWRNGTQTDYCSELHVTENDL